jgi:hypothetical protein
MQMEYWASAKMRADGTTAVSENVTSVAATGVGVYEITLDNDLAPDEVLATVTPWVEPGAPALPAAYSATIDLAGKVITLSFFSVADPPLAMNSGFSLRVDRIRPDP